MDTPRRYPYSQSWRETALIVLVLGGASIFFGFLTVSEKRGPAMYIVLVLCALVFLLALAVLAVRFFPRTIELMDDSVRLPISPFLSRVRSLRCADIVQLWENRTRDETALYIETSNDWFKIDASWLPNPASYQAVRDFIYAHASHIPRPPEQPTMTGRPSPGSIYESMYSSPVALIGTKHRLLLDPLLCWIEPAEYPRYRTALVLAATPRWCRLARAGRSFFLWFFPGLAFLLVFHLPVSGYLFIAIPGSLWFTWLGWDSMLNPARCSKILFFTSDIVTLSGLQAWSTAYKDIIGWDIVERTFEDRPLYFLLLQQHNHRTHSPYVAHWAFTDPGLHRQIEQLMQEQQIPHLSDLKLVWK